MRHWIVVLRFVEVTRIDIVRAASGETAGADFAGRLLAQKHPPLLPLIAIDTAEVPAARLRELVDETPAPVWPLPPAAPSLPVVGLCAAVRAYHVALADNAENAEATLEAFAEHHGVRIDFTGNRGGTP